MKMSTVTCPECAAENQLEAGTETGEIIVCSDCGVDLEVTALEPPTVQLAPMEEEDWGE
jgi:alpha-aminoadipate/glutamate carrier protein LysW